MRVPTKPESHYPIWLKPFFWSQQRRYGQVLNPGLIWGRVPKLFAAVAILYGVLDRRSSPLDPALRSMITVRVSQLNWCHFCVDINSAKMAERSGTMDKVLELENWRSCDLFDARERAVLDYTEAVTLSDRQVTSTEVDAVRHYFDDDGIVELTGLIAFQNLSSKFNAALDVPPQGFCHAPPNPEPAAEHNKPDTPC
ncbi:carboxymuconolactone decarboxylase family protein [Aestuariirhabdus sp. LZHN29]|uniref:carboxymuconolactone decarboxylase family protein n=1 Tax=Aestuariirhabdus sp. LZHN29 TaxID=3417462 RepID=UPI003CEA205A